MTNNILIAIVSFLPSIILGLLIWLRDPKKEPIQWLIKGFLIGCVLCFAVIYIEKGINFLLSGYEVNSSLLQIVTNAFLVAAIPEEMVKLLGLWFLLRKNPFFDEHIDGIVYAVFIGIGFAAIENILYLSRDNNWIFTAIVRSLLAVPGHYVFAVLMGFYYSLYHFVNHSKKNALYIIMVPVIVHGIYDTIAMSGIINQYVGLVCFFVLIVFCIYIHKKAQKRIKILINKDINATK